MTNGEWLIRVILLAVVTYALFSFTAMTINPADWNIVWRAIFGIIVLGIPIWSIINRSD